ncbi:MAG: family 16 glycosylhydrolase [Verrucomicrobiae bacterium]|nr:family 16 glycosylhydrolase [Verrucomicrobiae bacterium]
MWFRKTKPRSADAITLATRPRVAITLRCLALAAAIWFAHATAHASWQLVWADEFNGNEIDTNKWTFDIGNGVNGWGNWERQYYTSRTNNAFVADGFLHIVARRESYSNYPYTSARLKTQGRFGKTYGRFEFRAKLPRGLGFWPALWMLGTNITSVGWPSCGEIDVMEAKGSWTNTVQGTIHYADSAGNHTYQTKIHTFPNPTDSITNFHTYAVEWTSNQIKWLVDSATVHVWSNWSSAVGPFPAPFDRDFFIIMNLAIGGSYLGYPSDAEINAGTVFPGQMVVDYVRVYEYVPAPPSTPTWQAAAAANGKVYLSWAAPPGALGYLIKRSPTSGGPYAIIAAIATNAFVDTSVQNCASYYYTVRATNSVGASPDSIETPVHINAYHLAINSGGGTAMQFGADTNFAGGTQATPFSGTVDTNGLNAPAPQAVYQTERYGNFSYTFAGLIPGEEYLVRLHFAEVYWTSTNKRRFNVFINGTQVLTNFDIVAAAGAPNKAIIKEFAATPTTYGQINIQFTTVLDNAKCSGIELIIPRPGAPASLSATPADGAVTLTWTPAVAATSYNVKRANSPN